MRFLRELTLAAGVVLLSGCGAAGEVVRPRVSGKTAVHIESLNVDNYFVKGKNIQSFSAAPRRVLVVGENETETLLALGIETTGLMPVEQSKRDYEMRPENARRFRNIERIPNRYLNMEYTRGLDPELIIAQQCIFIRNRLDNTQYWNSRDIRTLIPLNTNTPSKHFYEETIEKEMQFIKDLGDVFHKEEEAAAIIGETYAAIDRINEEIRDMYKPRVMVIEFLSSMICYDRTKLVGDMIASIGGRISVNPPVISLEDVAREDPDILFVVCSHKDYGACMDNVTHNKGLKDLKCMKTGDVYSVPLRFTYGSLCRTRDGIEFLAERMYHKDFGGDI